MPSDTPDPQLEAARAAVLKDLQASGSPRGKKAAEDLLARIDAKQSRRDQDAARRQAKAAPQPQWAPVLVHGNPSGRLDVRVGPGSLPCEAVNLERTADGAFLVLRIPLAHCEVRLLQAAAPNRILQGPPPTPRADEPTPAPAGAVPEAADRPPASVANAMDAAIEEGLVLPAGSPEEPAPAPLAG